MNRRPPTGYVAFLVGIVVAILAFLVYLFTSLPQQ